MRVIDPVVDTLDFNLLAPGVNRRLQLELAGLVVTTVSILFGLLLAYSAKTVEFAGVERAVAASTIVDLHQLRSANDLVPLLTMFDDPFERRAVADALFRRATIDKPPLDHVGSLSAATIPAAQINKEPRFAVLRARLADRPMTQHLAVLTTSDITAIKPRVVVRTPAAYRTAVLAAVGWFVAAFWIAHACRRWFKADDDPVILPLLMLLCGIGMMTMLSLRDPLRDTVIASPFSAGVCAGCVLLVALSRCDLEPSRMRRAVAGPMALALLLAVLLLAFGSGPGSSGAKVNLFGVQPVEAIRLLVVLGLSAYFARRLEFLRELSEPVTPSRPWLQYIDVPRWRDVRPVVVSVALVLLFFFLQKDLGPALVLSCVFLALFGIARGRAVLVVLGIGLLLCGFGAAYQTGFPATVRQRVAIWLDPWSNGVVGGDQIAHGLWALATGATWGSGPGLGDPQTIPASHTDFILAAVGEELGFVGVAVVIGLYGLLCWRCLRVASRAAGDYTAFLAVGLALTLMVQASVIATGLLGMLPLSGVVTPFLSYGRSSMLANFAAVGAVLAIAARRGPVRPHLHRPILALGGVLAVVAAIVVGRAAWVQVVRADRIASAASLVGQRDGGYRFEYNPRLLAASRLIRRGTIFDRNGLPLATSEPDEIRDAPKIYHAAGLSPLETCEPDSGRCYLLGGPAFHVIGDSRYQSNWAARNSSYVERDSDAQLKGFDDRPRLVELTNPKTGVAERTIKRDYGSLLPLVRNPDQPDDPAVRAAISANRDVRLSIDARLQVRAASALRAGIEAGHHDRGAAVVIDVTSGEVLAAVSYPWPSPADLSARLAIVSGTDAADRVLDRARYGLYPPGSTFKLLVAGAALRSKSEADATFACVRLPDHRVGNYIPGISRPVRDDPTDLTPHGSVGLRRGLVVSCNAYFAQLAMRLGPRSLLDAASLFQIELAQPNTPASLQRALPQAGYGQGQVLVSPLKMARVVAAIAHGGVVPQVRWTKPGARENAPPGQTFLSKGDAALLSAYMREAVTSGTGRTVGSNPTPIAGKTGTAEIANGRAHSWFAGFAPFGAGPRKIAFAVVVENAGYGARAAAPIAGDIVTAARELGLFR